MPKKHMALCSIHNIVHIQCHISVANINSASTSSLLSLQVNGQTPLQNVFTHCSSRVVIWQFIVT